MRRLKSAQRRAETAERALRSARRDLYDIARQHAEAEADLEDARETKRGAKSQLLHILVTSNAQRRATLNDAIATNDTPELKIVRRFSSNAPDRAAGDAQPPPPDDRGSTPPPPLLDAPPAGA